MSKQTGNWPDLTRRVASDSFVIVGPDGQEYHPHKGEWVLLRQHLTPAMMKCILRFFGAKDALNRETALAYADTTDEMVQMLAKVVLDWNWTGPDGQAYPKPSYEVLSGTLSFDEVSWLVGELQERETEPNPTTPPPSS